MVRRDARADFERALRAHFLARISRLLTARRLDRTRPRHLGAAAALGWQSTRLRSIPLDAIVGTVDPTTDFDADFHPAAQRVAARWQRIARAHRVGRELPPISVIEQPDGYYVLDGRHRVSVARALGDAAVDAWVGQPVPGARTRLPIPRPRAARPMSRAIHAILSSATRALPTRDTT